MIELSIFIPYSPDIVISTFTTWFSLDLASLTGYQSMILTLFANAYFFWFWFFIIHFALKGFNKLYQKIF